MRKSILCLLCVLAILPATMMMNVAYASNYLTVMPGSAFVGQFRYIMIYVEAWDSAWNVWSTALWAENVPTGVSISFSPSIVYANSLIKSTMNVYPGPKSTAGTYTITIVARWTNIGGQWWERRTTLTLEVRGANEGDWTLNPALTLSQGRWRPKNYEWNWATSTEWTVPNTQYHYVNWWTNGEVDMMATDFVLDTIGDAGEMTQGSVFSGDVPVYQPPRVTLDTRISQLTFRATAYNIGTNFPAEVSSWTGIKFDFWATNTKDNRKLYVETYYVRTGANLAWFVYNPGNNYEGIRTLGSDIDDYLVDITSSAFSDRVKINTVGGTTYFTIDLSFFFQRAVGLFKQAYSQKPWLWPGWGGKTINDYSLGKAGSSLEASWVYLGGPIVYPQCWVTYSNIDLKGSYLPDVNCDGMVDILDAATVSYAYGSTFGSSSYLPAADINHDKIIDILDLALVSSYYGKTFP